MRLLLTHWDLSHSEPQHIDPVCFSESGLTEELLLKHSGPSAARTERQNRGPVEQLGQNQGREAEGGQLINTNIVKLRNIKAKVKTKKGV